MYCKIVVLFFGLLLIPGNIVNLLIVVSQCWGKSLECWERSAEQVAHGLVFCFVLVGATDWDLWSLRLLLVAQELYISALPQLRLPLRIRCCEPR